MGVIIRYDKTTVIFMLVMMEMHFFAVVSIAAAVIVQRQPINLSRAIMTHILEEGNHAKDVPNH